MKDTTFVLSDLLTKSNRTTLESYKVEERTFGTPCITMPVGVDYKPEEMKEQFLKQAEIIQTCHNCIKADTSSEHILDKEVINICQSKCKTCVNLNIACNKCKHEGQPSHIPSFRACQRCLEANQQCTRAIVLVLTSDCELGNKKTFELIEESKNGETLPPQFVFICLPDAVHVGKSLKCGSRTGKSLFVDTTHHRRRSLLSALQTS